MSGFCISLGRRPSPIRDNPYAGCGGSSGVRALRSMDGVMRISEGFFRRLLHHTPAEEALAALAGTWGPRVSPGQPSWGLSEGELVVHLVLEYRGAVAHGGHAAYFHAHQTEPGRGARAHLAGALSVLGLRALARSYAAASCLAPPGLDELTAAEIDRAMIARAPRGTMTLEALDAVVGADSALDQTLLSWLRARDNQILRPERGLPWDR